MDKIRNFLIKLAKCGRAITTRYVLLDTPDHIIEKFSGLNYVVVHNYEEALKIKRLNGYYVVLVAPKEYDKGDFPFIDIDDIMNISTDDIPFIIPKGGESICQKGAGKENIGQVSM